jgi:amidase
MLIKPVDHVMADEVWRWQACDQVNAIKARQITSQEAVASALQRLEQVNPGINAVVDVLAEEALAAASEADRALKRGDNLGPLHGIPVTIKINVDHAGSATTNAVAAFKVRIAKRDSPCVANWRNAGAIIIGRTNVPCFSARYFTDNALYGRTLNPWDPARTPGGSSGGAAAAVATGIGALAHGNDRAGSIRYPAYACGVMGLRPTFGRVPTFEETTPHEPSISTQLTNVQGLLARSIRDLRLGFASMTERDPRDPWWQPPDLKDRPTSPTRVAMMTQWNGIETEPAVRESVKTAARSLEAAGYQIEEIAPPCFEEAARLFFTLIRTEEKLGTTRSIDKLGDEPLRRARASTMAYAEELDFEGYVRALSRRATMLREWLLFFEQYSLLLTPVSAERAFPIDFDQQGDAPVRRMLTAHQPMLAVSVLGLPALSVPTGLVDGVPTGVQLVATRYNEELILSAGEVIEARQPVVTPIDPQPQIGASQTG